MIIWGDSDRFNASVNQKVNDSRFEFCLARLEVVTTYVGLLLLGELDDTGNKSVLGRAIDERNVFLNARKSKDSRRSDLGMRGANRSEDVCGGVVDAGNNLRIWFWENYNPRLLQFFFFFV